MIKFKIAIVCDWLTGVGGAEKVILAVHRMYPEAPIYTSQYRPKNIDWFKGATVKTGWLNVFPEKLKKFIPFLRQFYFSRLDLSDYDLVISITGAEAKAVKTGSNTLHISYMHAPTQYYWTLYDQYMRDPGFGALNPVVRFFFKLLVGLLRKADYKSAQNPNIIVANSSYIQTEIKKHYNRNSEVIWPNVDTEKTRNLVSKYSLSGQQKNGYIIYGRQVGWKRMDVAVEAAVKLNKKLLVVGYGPENARLKKLAAGSENIKFLPKYNGVEEIVRHITASKAFLFPAVEPFGIAAVESLAAGTPVIAYEKGGSTDIVEPRVNGVFFADQTVDSLCEAIKKFEGLEFDEFKVMQSAEKFSESEFVRKMDRLVEESLKK